MHGTQLEPFVRHLRRLVEAQATRDLSDAQLLEQFAYGRDDAAFAALMHRHGGLVWRVCRQVLHQQQDAEDAFQASFLVLAQKAAFLRREHGLGLGNWLYGVAYRVAMNARRKATRRQAHESRKAAATPRAHPSAEALHELQTLLHEEINHLPAKYRVTLVLCGLEGKSKSEAAKELGWKEGTVSGRLARARKMLEDRLARRGVMLSAAWAATTLGVEAAAAVMPSPLVWATTDAALRLAAGKALTAGVVSSQVAALMKGALKTMSLTKLKLAVTFVVGLGLFGIGVGMAAYTAFTDKLTPFSRELQASDDKPAPQATQSRVDLYGDPLPEGALARLGTVRFRHEDLETMALSPDGRVLITNSMSGRSICTWEADSGRLLWQIEQNGMTSATFSPNGRFVAEVCDCRYLNPKEEVSCIYLRDSKDGKALHRFPAEGGFPFTIWDAFFSPDSKVIGANDRGTIYLWSTETGRQLDKWVSPIPAGATIRFSSDGKTLIAASDGNTISHWNVAKRINLNPIELKTKEPYWREAMSDDGRLLAVAAGQIGEVPPFGAIRTTTLQLFDTTTGKECCAFQGDTTGIEALVLSRDAGTLVGVSLETEKRLHTISVWDTRDGKLKHRFPVRLAHSWRLGVTPDGGKVFASTTYNHGWLAHGPDESVVRWWDVATGKELMTKPAHEDRVESVCFTPDGRFVLSTGRDDTTRVWDIASGRSLHRVSNEGRYPTALSIVSSRGTFFSSGGDDTLCLYDWVTGRRLQSFAPPESSDAPDFVKSFGQVQAFVVSLDGNSATSLMARSWISGAEEQSFHLWDLAARKIRKSSVVPRSVRFSQFQPDGKSFIGFTKESKEVVVVDIETGRTEATLYHADREFMQTATAADGRALVTATTHAEYRDGHWIGIGPQIIHIWEMSSAKECMTITLQRNGSDDHCDHIAIAPDCRTIVTVSRGDTLRFWDMATGEELLQRTCAPARVTSLAFSPDSQVLATGHADSSILLWDLSSIRKHYQSLLTEADAQQLAAAWEDLANSDARKAHQAAGRLIAARDSATALLRSKLAPAPDVQRRIAGLIADLDHDSFVRRERASAELERLLPQVRPALMNALANKPSPELERRIESLLALPTLVVRDVQTLRDIRGVGVLEHIATAEAGDLLKNLAAGPPQARLTQEAKAAVVRLGKTATAKP
jgi:RNA polymerase sigma factor (sigma-70 family)